MRNRGERPQTTPPRHRDVLAVSGSAAKFDDVRISSRSSLRTSMTTSPMRTASNKSMSFGSAVLLRALASAWRSFVRGARDPHDGRAFVGYGAFEGRQGRRVPGREVDVGAGVDEPADAGRVAPERRVVQGRGAGRGLLVHLAPATSKASTISVRPSCAALASG